MPEFVLMPAPVITTTLRDFHTELAISWRRDSESGSTWVVGIVVVVGRHSGDRGSRRVESRVEVEVAVEVEVQWVTSLWWNRWGENRCSPPATSDGIFFEVYRQQGPGRGRPSRSVKGVDVGGWSSSRYASCRVGTDCGVASKLQAAALLSGLDGDKTARWGNGIEQVWILSGEVLRPTS